MRKLKGMLIFVLFALPLLAADRVLVNFHRGVSTNAAPRGWPSATLLTKGTNTPSGWSTNMTVADYKAYKLVRREAYQQWSSNLTWATTTFHQTNNAARQRASDKAIKLSIRNKADIKAYVESLSSLKFQMLTRKVVINILLEKQKQLNGTR